MRDLTSFIQRNSVVFITAYVVLSLVVITLLAVKLRGKNCDQVKPEILILKQYREKINQIDNAKDRATIDSLTFELFGFKSK